MYLSKVSFKPGNTARYAFLKLQKNGQYASHQLLWELFPHQENRNFLFREELTNNNYPYYYLLSKVKPSQVHQIFCVETKSFQPKLIKGDKLAFKLRVNPTKTKKSTDGNKNKRHDVMLNAKKQAQLQGVRDNEEIKSLMLNSAIEWLMDENRQANMGIELATTPDVEAYQYKTILKPKTNSKISFSMVDYQGVLTVKNVENLQSILQQGIGKSKAFGCGLMLIKPV